MYTQNQLNEIIQECCSILLEEEPMLFAKINNNSERSVSGALASVMKQYIEFYHVNCEYNRMTNGLHVQVPKAFSNESLVYPDIILHRQEDGDHNLLVIEMKMEWKSGKKEDDFIKLEKYIQDIKYKFGLYLELGDKGITDMRWFTK